LHKLSTKIVNENQVIVLEDLNVSGMVKNRKLARAISQQGWYEFRTLCEGKSEKLGREFRVISHWKLAKYAQTVGLSGVNWISTFVQYSVSIAVLSKTEISMQQEI
jgi:putative transposase